MGYTINSCILYNNNYLFKRFVQEDVINDLTIEISIFYAIFLMLL